MLKYFKKKRKKREESGLDETTELYYPLLPKWSQFHWPVLSNLHHTAWQQDSFGLSFNDIYIHTGDNEPVYRPS